MKELLRISHGKQDSLSEDVLCDYNLEVFEGDVLYIQGIDGSGIRTLADVLAGDRTLNGGSLFLKGRRTADYNRNSAFRYRIYTITAERDLVDSMTVAENLEAVRALPFAVRYYDRRKACREVTDYLEKEQVHIHAEDHVWTLSQKDRKKLSILKAKMHGADLIILDATHGFYEGREAEELCQLIRSVNQEGITFVILARHYTMFAEIATRIQILSHGIDLKEWDRIDDRVRKRLCSPVDMQVCGSEEEQDSSSESEPAFLGLYDYEWEMEQGFWQYLFTVRRQNPEIWQQEIRAQIPEDGCSCCGSTVVIPVNSGECLPENLSVEDNLILSIPGRVSKYRTGVIRKSICRNVAARFYRETGISPDRTRVEELDRVQKKILSVWRWELVHPEVMFLESPYSGLNPEEIQRMRTFLRRMDGKGIRVICFSRAWDEMKKDCQKVIVTVGGQSAKIATISHFFPPDRPERG